MAGGEGQPGRPPASLAQPGLHFERQEELTHGITGKFYHNQSLTDALYMYRDKVYIPWKAVGCLWCLWEGLWRREMKIVPGGHLAGLWTPVAPRGHTSSNGAFMAIYS